MLMRGPAALALFGTQCSQVRWQEPPITTRSPWPSGRLHGLAAAHGPQQQVTGRSHRQDGDHGVLAGAPADAVAVPGDAVPAVAVVAQPGRGERLAQLLRVVGAQRVAGLGEDGVGERGAGAVVREQPGHGDDLVVHLAPLGPPGHFGGQMVEERVGAVQPAGEQVDPGAAAEFGAAHAVERAEPQLVVLVEERALERREVVRAHGDQRTP